MGVSVGGITKTGALDGALVVAARGALVVGDAVGALVVTATGADVGAEVGN